MSNFNNKSITNKGLELLSAAMAGGKLEFTRIVMGSGTYSGDIGVIESLVNQKQSLDIKSITKKGSQVILSTTLLQSSITEDFYWKEIGVYAKGSDNLEVLYMYGSATDTSFISKDMLNEKMINVGVLVSNAQNVSATIDGSLVYLSRADLEAHNNDETAHKSLRSWVQSLFDSLKLTWDSITGKPDTFPPSEHNHDDRYYTESEIDTKLSGKANSTHTHTKSQITDFPTSLPANGGNADTVDGVHFHPNDSAPVSSNSTPYFYAFNGGDDTNCYVKNTNEINVNYANSAGNANTLGGYTLEQIKQMCGGDIVGKQMINLPSVYPKKESLTPFTYSNSKGGMLRITIPDLNGALSVTIIVDGVTVLTNLMVDRFCVKTSSDYDGQYEDYMLDIPFLSSVTIQPTSVSYSATINCMAYINK